MFEFKKEQLVFDIGGVKIGGNPGENATVMIGSIFFRKDKLVQDQTTGVFDHSRAKELIARMEELSDRTGLPAMLDVVCTNARNAQEYLGFAADNTDMPILIDAVSEEAAIAGLEFTKQLGLIDRTILNSLNPETKDPVYEEIRQVGLESAIALTFNSKALVSFRARIELLDTFIPKIKAAGISKILIDTAVVDIATLGLACKAIYEVKDKLGYPAGCGAHNAIDSWGALKKTKDKLLKLGCSCVVNGLPVAVGADFVLFGPIDVAEYMFPAVSIIDAAYGQVMMEKGKRPSPNHPRFKVPRF